MKHDTLPKINIAPENRPSQKESRLPTTNFQRLCQFQGGYPRWWFQTSFLLKSRKNGKMIQLDLQLRVVFQLGGFNHHLVIQPEERSVFLQYGFLMAPKIGVRSRHFCCCSLCFLWNGLASRVSSVFFLVVKACIRQ